MKLPVGERWVYVYDCEELAHIIVMAGSSKPTEWVGKLETQRRAGIAV